MKTNEELLELLNTSLDNLVSASEDGEISTTNLISLERQIKDHITTLIKLNEDLFKTEDNAIDYTISILELEDEQN